VEIALKHEHLLKVKGFISLQSFKETNQRKEENSLTAITFRATKLMTKSLTALEDWKYI
jgi:hypothetical protein